MDRRILSEDNALANPRSEPRNGNAVIAEYNGELIIRECCREASTFVLSPDNTDPQYEEDMVFDNPETADVEFRGVIR